jgi:hypothetical protein
MKCLFGAAAITLKPMNFENDELITRLRDAIIEAFISILHGIQPICSPGSAEERNLQNYCGQMLDYIDSLLKKPNLSYNSDFIKNIYELHSDIIQFYGQQLR